MLSPRPWHWNLVSPYLGTLCLGYAAGTLAMLWLLSPSSPVRWPRDHVTVIGGTLSFHGIALACLPALLRRHGASSHEAFGWLAPGIKRAIWLPLALSTVAVPLLLLLGQTAAVALEQLGWKPEAQAPVQMLLDNPSISLRWIIGIAAIGLAPVAEEIVFRGILYPMIKQHGFPRLALWGTSLLFAAIHGNLMTLLPFTALAIMLVLVYEATDNLLSPIVLHASFNFLNFVVLHLWGQAA